MRVLTLFCIFAVALSVACSTSLEFDPLGKPTPSDDAKESAAVYSAALEHEDMDKGSPISSSEATLYISSSSISVATVNWASPPGSFDEQFVSLKERYNSVDQEVLKSFLSKFQSQFEFTENPKLEIRMRYEFVDGNLVDRESKESVLGMQPSKLRGPILRLSRVGFNSTYGKALLEMEYTRCPLCGFGATYYLEKTDGNWKVKERFEHWVS